MSLLGELSQRFDFVSRLGTGAFGEVHEVREKSTGERRALKILHVQGDGRREQREIDACLRLQHPHLIRVYEGEVRDRQGYLLMELAEGSLAETIRNPTQLADNWRALQQATRGVAALHRAGLVHRDLKPANLLFVGGTLKVADMGLSRGLDMETVTATGMILGTPGYLSPEQARGVRATDASDTFALGVMFYEALELRLPYPDAGPLELLQLVAAGKIEEFRRAPSVLDAGLLQELRRALAYDPDARPVDLETWLELLGEPGNLGELSAIYLRPVGSGSDTGPRRVTLRPGESVPLREEVSTIRRRSRKGRFPIWVAGVALAASLFMGLLSGPDGADTPEAATAPEPPGVVANPLGEDFAARVREQLSDIQGYFIDDAGKVLEHREDGDGHVYELVDDDPLRWHVVIRHVPGLKRFHEWLDGGGHPEDFRPEFVRELQETDAFFLRQGLTRPFSPYLELGPEPPSELVWNRGLYLPQLHEALPEGPAWIHTVERLAGDLFILYADLDRSMYEEDPPALDAQTRSLLKVWRNVVRPDGQQAHEFFETAFGSDRVRASIQVFVRAGAETAQALLYAARRSMEEEPEVAELAGYMASHALFSIQCFYYSSLAVVPEEVFAGQELTPAHHMVRAAVLERRSDPFRGIAMHARARQLREASLRALRAASTPPFSETVGGRYRRWASHERLSEYFTQRKRYPDASRHWLEAEPHVRTRPLAWWRSVDRLLFSVIRDSPPRTVVGKLVNRILDDVLTNPAPIRPGLEGIRRQVLRSLHRLRAAGYHSRDLPPDPRATEDSGGNRKER